MRSFLHDKVLCGPRLDMLCFELLICDLCGSCFYKGPCLASNRWMAQYCKTLNLRLKVFRPPLVVK